MRKLEVNTIQQAIDNCIEFVSNPDSFVMNNHTHVVEDITDLKDFITDTFSQMTGSIMEVIRRGQTHENILNPKTNTIYFELFEENEEQGNTYKEYMYINGEWELIGSSTIDLSQYYTKEKLYTKKEVDNLFENYLTKDHVATSGADKNKIPTVGIVDTMIEKEKPDPNQTLKVQVNGTEKTSYDGSSNVSVNLQQSDGIKVIHVLNSGVDKISFSLLKASNTTLGGIKIGFNEDGKNYPLQLDENGKAYVTIPWSDTWNENTTAQDGFVKATGGKSNQVYKTDSNGIPGWRDVSDTKLSTISNNPIANKVVATELNTIKSDTTTHTQDTSIHITEEERTTWNGILDKAKDYSYDLFTNQDKLSIAIIPDGSTHDSVTEPKEGTFYFEKVSTEEGQNIYDEYIYVNGSWEKIGQRNIDLSDYYTKIEITELINAAKTVIDTSLSTTSENPVQNKVVTEKINELSTSIEETSTNLANHNHNENYYTKSEVETQINTKADDKEMVGSTVSSEGTRGLVPAPPQSDVGLFLKSDGSWGIPDSSPSIKVDSIILDSFTITRDILSTSNPNKTITKRVSLNTETEYTVFFNGVKLSGIPSNLQSWNYTATCKLIDSSSGADVESASFTLETAENIASAAHHISTNHSFSTVDILDPSLVITISWSGNLKQKRSFATGSYTKNGVRVTGMGTKFEWGRSLVFGQGFTLDVSGVNWSALKMSYGSTSQYATDGIVYRTLMVKNSGSTQTGGWEGFEVTRNGNIITVYYVGYPSDATDNQFIFFFDDAYNTVVAHVSVPSFTQTITPYYLSLRYPEVKSNESFLPRGEYTDNIDDLYGYGKAGIYWIIPSATGKKPHDGYFNLIVASASETGAIQIGITYINDGSPSDMLFRSRVNGIWLPWAKVLTG